MNKGTEMLENFLGDFKPDEDKIPEKTKISFKVSSNFMERLRKLFNLKCHHQVTEHALDFLNLAADGIESGEKIALVKFNESKKIEKLKVIELKVD